jgi:murein L,D-transpeptidase YcbB/YkuD
MGWFFYCPVYKILMAVAAKFISSYKHFLMALFRNSMPLAAIFLLMFIQASCNNNNPSPLVKAAKDTTAPAAGNKDASIPGNFSNQTQLKFDSTELAAFIDSFAQFKVFAKDLYSFYSNRQFAYAWFDDNGLIEPAHNLYSRIVNITEDGISAKLPYKNAFGELMETQNGNLPQTKLECMLTCQYLEYASVVWQGLNEKQTKSIDWFLPRKKLSTSQLLDSLASNTILQNEPVYRQYHLLKDYLKKYRDIQAAGNLPTIKTDKKKLQPGDSGVVITNIREWLYQTGDLPSNNKSNVFDTELTNAVKTFQQRNGLTADGVIGPGVIAEMNIPIAKKIDIIMLNMERSRWVPSSLQANYLLVNIPEYKLHIIENDNPVFSMNVVVGKSQHKTVIFNGDLKHVVFSPYWNVPPGILKNEVLPGIRRNKNYLASHNMEWNGGNVRQKPGPNNSLGLVKFLFPNSHAIYLHDSPAKSLFNETNRAFSHGCIRVAEPKKLALYLLRNETGWNDATVTAAMNKGQEQFVNLKQTVPVFIAYFTAWVDRQGKLNFRKDVYGRDGRLAKLVLDKPSL